jgi:polysaccharide pyruvyl transferase WcaK-like protein
VFDKNPAMVDALAAALDNLAGRMDARVIFLANEVRDDPKFDKATALRIMRRMTRADRSFLAPNDYFSPQEMMSIIGCCDLTLSMRYHFCLFSALQRTPFIAIQRSDKVADLCWDIGWQAAVQPPHFSDNEISEHGIRLLQTSDVRKQLEQITQEMSARALRSSIALHALRNKERVPVGEQSPAGREL